MPIYIYYCLQFS